MRDDNVHCFFRECFWIGTTESALTESVTRSMFRLAIMATSQVLLRAIQPSSFTTPTGLGNEGGLAEVVDLTVWSVKNGIGIRAMNSAFTYVPSVPDKPMATESQTRRTIVQMMQLAIRR